MIYIVELEKNVYIAPWEGDSGTNIVKRYAKIFKEKKDAEKALCEVLVFRNYENARVINIGGEL